MGFLLHKPYPYSLYDGVPAEPSSLGTNEMFGELGYLHLFTVVLGDEMLHSYMGISC